MLLLLALVTLSMSSSCPYCKWGSCSVSQTSIGSCSACYDIAGLVPVKIAESGSNGEIDGIGVCQLCPDHCNACEYALATPLTAPPRGVLNCTDCQDMYATDHWTGKCEPCPSDCDSCEWALIAQPPYGLINCTSCHDGFTNNLFTGECKACPQNCLECSCILKGCPSVTCDACASGYSLTQPQDGVRLCTEDGAGRRLSAGKPLQ